MTNITKAAKQALAELADWHWSQATTLRKAACTSAMDKPEPGQSSLNRMADWHDTQKSIIRVALQDKAVEPMTPEDMHTAAMDAMNRIPALANHHSWKGWPGTWALAIAAVNGITAKAEGGA